MFCAGRATVRKVCLLLDGRNPNLRKLQYEAAKRENVTMQIWLGKQWLGQKERPESEEKADTLGELLAEYRKRHEYLTRNDAS
jgi:agmatine/peptidylarginine deiminase